MKGLFSEIRGAVMSTLILAIVCCGIYPLVVFGIAQVAFFSKANGSLILAKDGTIRGSKLIGQNFGAENFFHPRPSAAGANGYDAMNSGGSNLGPSSSNLVATVAQRIADYRSQNKLETNAVVPADAVTASGSGLDPHISLRNAELQVPRVAKARGLIVERVMELVRASTEAPDLGLLGEARVNVLTLNLALDRLQ
jgi:K+-transporting ATPase ATPase C chain